MKPLLLILLFYPFQSQAVSISVLMLDSSFPPLKTDEFKFGHSNCSLLEESNADVPAMGECYATDDWKGLAKIDEKILKGLMDSLAKVETPEAKIFATYQSEHPAEVKKLKADYILSTHGTRSAFVFNQFAAGAAKIIPLRVLSTQAGTIKQSSTKRIQKFQAYGNGCGLRKWEESDADAISKGNIQPYQERIAKILTTEKSVRIVSLSLGYKKKWIEEDNPQCSPEQAALEYDILRETWKNLLTRFRDRLFVVAAGNEGQNFDNETVRSEDLWASLDKEPNLLLVGSNKVDGARLDSSNYGAKVLMVKGEKIDALSPLPTAGKSHKTTLRGTSFSAPVVAGLVAKIWAKQPELDIAGVRKVVSEQAKAVK